MDNTNCSSEELIPIQICYVEKNKQIILDILVAEKTNLIEAIKQSEILNKLGIQIKEGEVGIYGKKKPFNIQLKTNDRIEIYRKLQTSPQEIRRNRALNKSRHLS